MIWEMDWSQWNAAKELVVDLDFLPLAYVNPLPLVSPVRPINGRSWFLWNPGRELNAHQLEALAVFPYLMWNYAKHVAKSWQDATGRLPEVHVSNQGWLNHHGFQPMIDSSVDLARQPYHLLLHNPWILPRSGD